MNALRRLCIRFYMLLERLKVWVVEKSLQKHEYEAELCRQWLEDRRRRNRPGNAIKMAGFFKLRSDPDE